MRSGALRARWGLRRVSALEDHLRSYLVLSIDSDVADWWARLRAACEERGQRVGENDLWIAATAARHDVPLATFDRALDGIPGITVLREDGSEVTNPL